MFPPEHLTYLTKKDVTKVKLTIFHSRMYLDVPRCGLGTREGFLRKNIAAVSFFQNCAIHPYS